MKKKTQIGICLMSILLLFCLVNLPIFAQTNLIIQNSNSSSITILPSSIGSRKPQMTGLYNTAFGNSALLGITSGIYNVALGENTMLVNQTGSYNTALGSLALNANVSGNYNTATGWNALNANTGSYNVANGYLTLKANTTGTDNVGIGSSALTANIGGGSNIAIGSSAMLKNTSGLQNVAVGGSAMSANMGGNNNTALGFQALSANTAGSSNVAVGYDALNLAIGSNNVGVGNQALVKNTGNYNIGVGAFCMPANTTGSNNVAIGEQALNTNITGSGNVAIGTTAGFSETGSNKLYIDNSGSITPLIGGDFSFNIVGINMNVVNLANNSTYKLQVAGDIYSTTNIRAASGVYANNVLLTSDKRFKKNIVPLENSLSKILALDGVNYHWRKAEFPEKNFSESPQIGFIAQDVEKVFPELVQTDDKGFKSVNYVQLVPALVEAIKELSRKIGVLESKNLSTKVDK